MRKAKVASDRDRVTGKPLGLLYVSAVSLAEIRFGIEGVDDPGKRAERADWLAHKLRPMFEQRVLQVSEDVMFRWRLLVEEGRKARHRFSQPDIIIAATALELRSDCIGSELQLFVLALSRAEPDSTSAESALTHGLTVVSRDVADFERARVPVVNPWKG